MIVSRENMVQDGVVPGWARAGDGVNRNYCPDPSIDRAQDRAQHADVGFNPADDHGTRCPAADSVGKTVAGESAEPQAVEHAARFSKIVNCGVQARGLFADFIQSHRRPSTMKFAPLAECMLRRSGRNILDEVRLISRRRGQFPAIRQYFESGWAMPFARLKEQSLHVHANHAGISIKRAELEYHGVTGIVCSRSHIT